MALDPQDLLIFKVREEDAETPIQKKKKPEDQAAPEIKRVQQPQQPMPKQTIIQNPNPRLNVQVPAQQKPVQQAKPQAPPQQPQLEAKQALEQLQKISQPQQKKSLWGNLTSYKPPPEPQDEVEQLEEKKMMAEPIRLKVEAPKEVPARELIEAAIDNRLDGAVGDGQAKIRVSRQAKNPRESRKMAQRMDCATHPWRRAYALCEYCGRPFCYEDIMEYGNAYYCLDDIDKVSYAIRNSEIVKYNRLSLISASLLAIAFFVFMYYNYAIEISIILGVQHTGIVNYLSNPDFDQLILLGDLLLMALSFIAAITIILETQISFRFTALIGLITVATFSYQFLNGVDKFYFAAIAACSFIGLATLAYSRVAYDSVPDDGFAAREVELSKSTGF